MDELAIRRINLTLLYISVAILITGPFFVHGCLADIRNQLTEQCFNDIHNSYTYCRDNALRDAKLPLYYYFFPFLPITLFLWTKWVAGFASPVEPDSCPFRLIALLRWYGALGVIITVIWPAYRILIADKTWGPAMWEFFVFEL